MEQDERKAIIADTIAEWAARRGAAHCANFYRRLAADRQQSEKLAKEIAASMLLALGRKWPSDDQEL
jgi:hypothetical protein